MLTRSKVSLKPKCSTKALPIIGKTRVVKPNISIVTDETKSESLAFYSGYILSPPLRASAPENDMQMPRAAPARVIPIAIISGESGRWKI